jgi:hypothetical protein
MNTAMSRSLKMPAAQREKINRWVTLAGFVALAVILLIEGMALYHLHEDSIRFLPPATVWPETIMRLLFGQAR